MRALPPPPPPLPPSPLPLPRLLALVVIAALAFSAVAHLWATRVGVEGVKECEGVGLHMLVPGRGGGSGGGGGGGTGPGASSDASDASAAGGVASTVRAILRCARAAEGGDATTIGGGGGTFFGAAGSFPLALPLAAAYVTLQALAIPGPLLLSIVAGALYGVVNGSLFVALCATTGASLCYMLSASVAGPLVTWAAPERLAALRRRVAGARAKGVLVWYLLFLRLTPLAPNWLVNAASPVVGVPLAPFVLATAVGLVPANYFHTSLGAAIAAGVGGGTGGGGGGGGGGGEAGAGGWTSFLVLFGLQFVALLPTLLLRGRAEEMERELGG